MEKFKSFIKLFLGAPLTIISFYFIYKLIGGNFAQVYPRIQDINLLPLILGVFFLIVFFLFRALSWNKLADQEGYKLDIRKSIYFYSFSEIRRYIPGSILAFASRVYKFNTLKIPKKTTLKLIFYEVIIFVLSSLLISIPGIVFIAQKLLGLHTLNIFAFSLIAALIFAFFSLRNSKQIKFIIQNASRFTTPLALMLTAWVFFGLGNLLIATSIYFLDPRKIIELVSLFVFSWLIGYIILVAPLGLGVREAAIIYGLSYFVPLPIAATIAIFSRVVLILSDLIFFVASYISYKFVKIKFKIDYYLLALWSAIVSYTFYFSYVAFEKHANFFTGRFDLGNMDQTVWNTLHGRIFELTNPDGVNTISRLSVHADFILILLAPFYSIWEDPRMLLLIQTAVLSLGAYFIFKISEKTLNNKSISLIFSISYLLNPFVQKQNLFDFHPVTLATTFLLATFYFAISNKLKLSLLFLLLALLTKENMYLVSFLFGIYLYLRTKNKYYILLSTASLLIFWLIITKFIPEARGGEHFAAEYFQDFGLSPAEIVKNALLDPLKTISLIATPANLSYAYKLLLPTGFTAVLSPLYLIFALPDILINTLSRNENLRSINFHYQAVIIPFVYISSICAIKTLLGLKNKFLNNITISTFLILFTLYSTFQYGTLPGSKNPSLEIYEKHLTNREKIANFLHKIPQDLSVASTNNLGAHLSHRKLLFTIPQGIYDADVVVFLLNDSYAKPSLARQKVWAEELKHNPSYIMLLDDHGFIAFYKRKFYLPISL